MQFRDREITQEQAERLLDAMVDRGITEEQADRLLDAVLLTPVKYDEAISRAAERLTDSYAGHRYDGHTLEVLVDAEAWNALLRALRKTELELREPW